MKAVEPVKIGSITTDWLQERYRFDATARNRELEKIVLDFFSHRSNLYIVDVGAGVGANSRYYENFFPCKPKWTLVEIDEVLVKQGQSVLSKCFASYVTGSLLELPDIVNLEKVDLVTANAVFDLFSREQFQRFIHSLANYRIPFLTTLNYQSMRFEPQVCGDGEYIRLYENHMIRQQNFGSAMGPECSAQMIEVMQNAGFEVVQGRSPWSITSADEKMMKYILQFMREAIGELSVSQTESVQLDQWISDKQQMVSQGKLELWVEHVDLFGRFS